MKQRDLLVVKDDKKVSDLKKDMQAPSNYFRIDLPSCGKLDYPDHLYVRDYSLEEMLELSTIGQNPDSFENELETVECFLKALDKMIYNPDNSFSTVDLHEKDLITLLTSLKINVCLESSILKSMKYYYNEDLPEDKIEEPVNIGVVDIDMTRLEIRKIKDNFKEPFLFTDRKTGQKIYARTQRLKDIILAGRQVIKETSKEVDKYGDLKEILIYNKAIDEKNISDDEKLKLKKPVDERRLVEFKKLATRRVMLQLMYTRAQTILKIDDKELNTFEEKIQNIGNIPTTFWKFYDKIIIKEYDQFGVMPSYTFHCDKLKKHITRGFQFRYLDFLPDNEPERTDQYDFSFDF